MHPRERRKREENGLGGADGAGGVSGSNGGAWSELASSSYRVEPLQKPEHTEHTFSHSFFTAQEAAGACLYDRRRCSLAPRHHGAAYRQMRGLGFRPGHGRLVYGDHHAIHCWFICTYPRRLVLTVRSARNWHVGFVSSRVP